MPEPINKRIGTHILQLRLQQKLNQEELAFRSALSTSFLGSMERGKANPSIEALDRVATALQVDVSDLVSRDSQWIIPPEDQLPLRYQLYYQQLTPREREQVCQTLDKIIRLRNLCRQ